MGKYSSVSNGPKRMDYLYMLVHLRKLVSCMYSPEFNELCELVSSGFIAPILIFKCVLPFLVFSFINCGSGKNYDLNLEKKQ